MHSFFVREKSLGKIKHMQRASISNDNIFEVLWARCSVLPRAIATTLGAQRV